MPWHRKTPTGWRKNSGRFAHHRTIAQATTARRWPQRLHPLIRAVEVFGFHLATVDLRQSSDKHEEVVAELLATARIEPTTRLDEAAKRALLTQAAERRPPLRVHGAGTRPTPQGELAIFDMARHARALWPGQAIRHYIISHTETVSDLLEVLLLQKEVGLMRGTLDTESTTRPDRGAAVRNH
jgi:phosphoenolpyruvate carboxylase